MIRPITIRPIAARGYAQALFLVVMTLLTSLTLLVLTAVNADLTSSHRDVALAQARALAETGLEEFDSQLLQNTDRTLDPLLADPSLLATSATLPALPAYHQWVTYQPAPAAGPVNRSGGATTGTAQPCVHTVNGQTVPDYTRDCFYVDVDPAQKTVDLGGGQTGTDAPMVEVSVIARTRCAGEAFKCTYAGLQQRLRNRQLFDYLFYTQFDALDPNLYPQTATNGDLSAAQAAQLCANRYATRPLSAANGDNLSIAGGGDTGPRDPRCVDVAYQADPTLSGDQVRGPVFTNDDRIVVCGQPQFTDPITVAGDGTTEPGGFWESAATLHADDTGCAGSQPRNAADTAVAPGFPCHELCTLTLPDASKTEAAFAAATAAAYVLTQPAATPVAVAVNAPTTAGGKSTLTVTLTPATGPEQVSTLPLPANGLLYVKGNATLSGTLAGKLSVYATGTLTVTGDVRYCAHADGSGALCDPTSTGAVTPAGFTTRLGALNADPNDLLVLMAGNAVQLAQPPAIGTQRELDALLIALGNAVSVQNWSTVQPWATGTPSATPQLHFFGAMAARYQGVFGSYGSATGAITSGYHKDFYFDTRLHDNKVSLPYYSLSPGQPNWVRVDTSDQPGKLACTRAGISCG